MSELLLAVQEWVTKKVDMSIITNPESRLINNRNKLNGGGGDCWRNESYMYLCLCCMNIVLEYVFAKGHHSTISVFSPAYLRHVGPASLQQRYFFDVGKEKGQLL